MKRPVFFLAFIFLCLMLNFNSVQAQIAIQESFSSRLEKAQLSYFPPPENTYKEIKVHKNSIQHYEYAIRSKKKDMEIRYLVDPFLTESPLNHIPTVQSMQKASHIAANDEDSNIAVHSIDAPVLAKYYNADWGVSFIFRPKTIFSDKQFCKMTVLYAEGKGIVYVFYLFDQPGEELENQAYCFKFND